MAMINGNNLPVEAFQPEAIREAMLRQASKGGRPSTYDPEITAELCRRLIDGESLRSICKDPRMPAAPTVYDWIDHVPEFAKQYSRARLFLATGMVHEGLEILDTADDSSMPKVRKAESRANYRLEIAKRLDRQTWGDKQIVEHDIGDNLAEQLRIARERRQVLQADASAVIDVTPEAVG